MSGLVYTRWELVRLLRNRRFLVLSLGFPLLLYFVVATPNRNVHDLGGSGVSAPLYLMVGLAAFGAMNGVMGVGARISAERVLGWNRQLRLTPLAPGVYFSAKVLGAYLTASMALGLLYASGVALGVRLSAQVWLEMSGLLLVGLVPFVALGVVISHLLPSDTIGPALGGMTALFGLLGGAWYPVAHGGVLHAIASGLPSYWLVQASRLGAGGSTWTATGWIVVGLWALAGIGLARWAYRRDTQRA